VQKIVLEVVENQLRDGAPPEARATMARLLAEGHSREEALKLIGCAFSVEIWEVMANKQPYNEARYLAALRNLPQIPGDGGEETST